MLQYWYILKQETIYDSQEHYKLIDLNKVISPQRLLNKFII